MFEEYCGIYPFEVLFETEPPMWSEGAYRNDSIRNTMSAQDSCSVFGELHKLLFRRMVQGQGLSDNPKLRI